MRGLLLYVCLNVPWTVQCPWAYVCLCVGHDCEHCKNGRANQDAVKGQTRVCGGASIPQCEWALRGACTQHQLGNGRIQSSRQPDATTQPHYAVGASRRYDAGCRYHYSSNLSSVYCIVIADVCCVCDGKSFLA